MMLIRTRVPLSKVREVRFDETGAIAYFLFRYIAVEAVNNKKAGSSIRQTGFKTCLRPELINITRANK